MKAVEEILSNFDVFCEQSVRVNRINYTSRSTLGGLTEHFRLFGERLEILNKELVDKANEILVENPDVDGLRDELLKIAKSRLEQFISENR